LETVGARETVCGVAFGSTGLMGLAPNLLKQIVKAAGGNTQASASFAAVDRFAGNEQPGVLAGVAA